MNHALLINHATHLPHCIKSIHTGGYHQQYRRSLCTSKQLMPCRTAHAYEIRWGCQVFKIPLFLSNLCEVRNLTSVEPLTWMTEKARIIGS